MVIIQYEKQSSEHLSTNLAKLVLIVKVSVYECHVFPRY